MSSPLSSSNYSNYNQSNTDLNNEISSLSPSLVWQYFYALTQIPRPSYQEEAVQQFVLEEAARLGLWAERDAAGNVLVDRKSVV